MYLDFNAHNRAWNCEKKTDRNGEILQEEMEDRDMYVVNRDILTRIGERGRRYSNLNSNFYVSA